MGKTAWKCRFVRAFTGSLFHVKDQNYENPELRNSKLKTCCMVCMHTKMITISSFKNQLSYRQTENTSEKLLFCFVCFVALRPKSTAMVMAGRSVHLTTHIPGQA